ncbi:GerAB/ArcD/ProY family transporter [Evansella sp. AB-rgal1]|uniref:GerAB/ArcD/ProY family transporter n=1 Tax=Evansella sp. AB-rgal1 TaxID=3242696 RepID=UPI00359E2C1C
MKLQTEKKDFGNIELFVFIYCSTIALGIIFLPYISAEEIRSAWLKVMVGVIPYLIFLFLLNKVIRKHNDRDVLKVLKDLSFNWLYYPVMIYLLLSTIYSIFWGIKSLAIVIQTYLLQNTQQWVVIVTFLIFVGISLMYGITAITRLIVLMFICEIGVIASLVALLFSQDFRWIYIPPVFTVDVFTFLKSSISETTRYAGLITILTFLPLVKKETKIIKTSYMSLLLIMIMFTLVSILTLGTFGFEQTLTLLSPITALIQTTYAEMTLFERLDLFFLTIWIWALYKAALIYFWFAISITKRIIPFQKKKEWIPITIYVVIIMIVTVATPSFVNLSWEPYNINLLISTIVLPILLFTYMLLRKKRSVKE